VKLQHRQAAAFVLAAARRRPDVVIVTWDRRRDAKDVASDLRELAREEGVRAKVKAHANGAVEVVVPGA
jgi:hypothetical protein